MVAKTGLLLEHFARLAANSAATAAAAVSVLSRRNDRGPRQASHGLTREQSAAVADVGRVLSTSSGVTIVPDLALDKRFNSKSALFEDPGFRFLVHVNLLSSGGDRVGFICLLDPCPGRGLNEAQMTSLGHISEMIIADRRREQRHLHLMHVADRALRVDRMLRMVSDAASCADALTVLLEELCVFHGAAVGRIWQLVHPDKPLLELSRFQQLDTAASDTDPLTDVGDGTMDAIRRNAPFAVSASQLGTGVTISNNPVPERLGHACIPIWVQQQRFGISLFLAGEEPYLDTVVADISSLANTIRPALLRKVTEERIHFAAHHDDLTKLPNRMMFQDRLRKVLVSAQSAGDGFALLYLDLDGFKRVNDTRGHEIGDKLLLNVAERLRDSVRETDTVARIGGDEFAIIQQFGTDPSSAYALAQRIIETIARPFDLADRRSSIGVSIGIALYPQHGDSPDILIRNADVALYSAKRAGRNTFRLFDREIKVVQQNRLLQEQDLRDAINAESFTLAYQPVCDSNSLRVVGFEALLRWTSSAKGPIHPDQFISMAEHSELIVPLGRWALEAACVEAATWDPGVSLSVNVSPLQFRQRDLAQQISDVLARTGLPPDRLELEVTEGFLLDDSELVLSTMRAFQEQGIRVSLDDFGTAYASLSYLRRFPFDGIKIDKSFVRGLGDNVNTLAIVEAMLSLGDRLNLEVVAEGVETEHELLLLRKLGCRLVQGYLLGRPTESHQVHALLRQSKILYDCERDPVRRPERYDRVPR